MNDHPVDARHSAREDFADSLEQLKSLFEVMDAEEAAAKAEEVMAEDNELTWEEIARDLDSHFKSQPPQEK